MNQHKNFSSLDHVIGTVSKEHEFSAEKKEDIIMTESVGKELPEEVSAFIQSNQEEPRIHPDLQKVGVKKTMSVPRYARQNTITLPLTDDMVERGLHAPITSSLRWLAEWSVFILKKAHIVLKKVHGHIKRIIQ